MNPDFTLIWPLSCLKDGDHLWMRHGVMARFRRRIAAQQQS